MTPGAAAPAGAPQAPALKRRLACLIYEALVLFGVGLVSGAIGTVVLNVTGATDGPTRTWLLQLTGVAVYGAYFVWFWSRRGQTLPMQTWRIKLITPDGRLPGVGRSLARYVACALWFAPGAALAAFNHWPPVTTLVSVGVGMLLYALSSRLHPQHQFWHDVLCGTRLVDAEGPAPRR